MSASEEEVAFYASTDDLALLGLVEQCCEETNEIDIPNVQKTPALLSPIASNDGSPSKSSSSSDASSSDSSTDSESNSSSDSSESTDAEESDEESADLASNVDCKGTTKENENLREAIALCVHYSEIYQEGYQTMISYKEQQQEYYASRKKPFTERSLKFFNQIQSIMDTYNNILYLNAEYKYHLIAKQNQLKKSNDDQISQDEPASLSENILPGTLRKEEQDLNEVVSETYGSQLTEKKSSSIRTPDQHYSSDSGISLVDEKVKTNKWLPPLHPVKDSEKHSIESLHSNEKMQISHGQDSKTKWREKSPEKETSSFVLERSCKSIPEISGHRSNANNEKDVLTDSSAVTAGICYGIAKCKNDHEIGIPKTTQSHNSEKPQLNQLPRNVEEKDSNITALSTTREQGGVEQKKGSLILSEKKVGVRNTYKNRAIQTKVKGKYHNIIKRLRGNYKIPLKRNSERAREHSTKRPYNRNLHKSAKSIDIINEDQHIKKYVNNQKQATEEKLNLKQSQDCKSKTPESQMLARQTAKSSKYLYENKYQNSKKGRDYKELGRKLSASLLLDKVRRKTSSAFNTENGIPQFGLGKHLLVTIPLNKLNSTFVESLRKRKVEAETKILAEKCEAVPFSIKNDLDLSSDDSNDDDNYRYVRKTKKRKIESTSHHRSKASTYRYIYSSDSSDIDICN